MVSPTNWNREKILLTADDPGHIIKNVMRMVVDRLMFMTRSANAVAPNVSLSALLLVLVLITAIAGVQT